MNYWDYLRQLQKMMDSIAPVQKELLRLQQLHEQMMPGRDVEMALADIEAKHRLLQRAAVPVLTRDLLNQVSANHSTLQAVASLMPSPALLKAAIQSLPDLRTFGFNVAEIITSYDRLNANIHEAEFLLELEVQEGPPDHEGQLLEEAESRLVEIASPEAIEALRSVQFEPILLVDRAMRRPESMREMSPRDFEVFVASLVEQLGFDDVILTPRSNDHGRDVLATKKVHGISIFFAFECKRYGVDQPVGKAIIRALLGTVVQRDTRATKGVLVTTSRFTSGAQSLILTEPSLGGVDFDGLLGWLSEYGTKRRAT